MSNAAREEQYHITPGAKDRAKLLTIISLRIYVYRNRSVLLVSKTKKACRKSNLSLTYSISITVSTFNYSYT